MAKQMLQKKYKAPENWQLTDEKKACTMAATQRFSVTDVNQINQGN